MGDFKGALADFQSAVAGVKSGFHGGSYDTLNTIAGQTSSIMGGFSSFFDKGKADCDAQARMMKKLFPKGLDGIDEEMRNFEREIGWNERTGSFTSTRGSARPPSGYASTSPMPGGTVARPSPRPITPSLPRPPISPAPSRPTMTHAASSSSASIMPTIVASGTRMPRISAMTASHSSSASTTPVPSSDTDKASQSLAQKYAEAWDAYRKHMYPALCRCGMIITLRGKIGSALDEVARIVVELNRLSSTKFDSRATDARRRELTAVEGRLQAQGRLVEKCLAALPGNDSWMASAKDNLDAAKRELSDAEAALKSRPAWVEDRCQTVDGFRKRFAQISSDRMSLESQLKRQKASCDRIARDIASLSGSLSDVVAAENARVSKIASEKARGEALCRNAENAYQRLNPKTALRFTLRQSGGRWTASPSKAEFLRELDAFEAPLVRLLEARARQVGELQKPTASLSPSDINDTDAFPSFVIVDSCAVSLAGCRIDLPIPSAFPFGKPRYFRDSSEIEPFLLRLVCALPVGSVQITMLDIEKKGDNGRLFNNLAKAGRDTFRLVTDIGDLGGVLKEHGSYIASLASSGKFTATVGNWVAYNASHPRNPLPFRILVVHSIHGWDERDVDELADLFVCGPDSGVHVFFALDGMETLDDRVRAKVETWPSKATTSPVDVVKWAKEGGVLKPTRIPMRLPSPSQVERILDAYADLCVKRSARAAHVFADLFAGMPVWSASSIDGLEAPVGWDDTGDPVNIRVGDDNPHALIGGKTGGGKTNLIHVIICSLCHRYSPEELQICLLDMKDGVEAFRYLDSSRRAWLPHAKAILASQSPHFASKYLEAMIAEMKSRNGTFKRDGAAKIGEWRKKTGKKMPRILFVADEFTHMFADSDVAKKASSALQELLQLGRSCGIHVLLATQDTNALTTANAGVILSQTPLRFALPDAPGVLASGNHADRTIHKPQCILNESRGEDGMNRVFVHPFFDNETKSPGDVDLFRKTMEVTKVHLGGASLPVCKVVDSMSLAPVPPFAVFQKSIVSASAGGRPSVGLLLGRADDFDGDAFMLRLYGDVYRDHLLIAGECDPNGREGVWNGLRKSIVWSLACLADKQVLFYDPLREKPFKAPDFTVLCQSDGPNKVYENLVALRDSKARNRVLVIENFDQAGHVFFRENSYSAPDPDTAMGVLYSAFDAKKKAFTVILLVRDFTAATEILGDDGLKAMSHRIAFGYGSANELRPIIKGTDMLDNPGESIFYSGSGIRGGGYATILPFAEPDKQP